MVAFSDFIAPFDPVDFKANYYGRKPLHIPRQGRPFDNPLPWGRFNEILDLKPYWNEETLQVFYKSRLALRENYCDVSDVAPGAKAPTDPGKVKALLGFGASLVANHVHNVCPAVASATHMLQREFAAGCGANVYCSFRQVQAFSTHFDLHDVFALQTEGEKLWHVYEKRMDNPVAPMPPGDEAERWLVDNRGALLLEVLMKPGDILYLPRGQFHDAITSADSSMHVTYWLKPATGLSLFKLLEAAVAPESDFRAYLPPAADKAALQEHLRRLSARLDGIINSPAFAIDIQNHQRAFAASPANFELPGQRRPHYFSPARRGQVIRRDEGFVAAFDRTEVPVGAAHAAISWLLAQRVFSLEDLMSRYPYVDEGELRGVLQQLLQIGAVVETQMQ